MLDQTTVNTITQLELWVMCPKSGSTCIGKSLVAARLSSFLETHQNSFGGSRGWQTNLRRQIRAPSANHCTWCSLSFHTTIFQFCRNWDNGFLATTPKTIFKVCFQLSLWNNRWCQHYKRGRGMFVTLMARLLQTGCCASFLLLLVGGRNAYQAPVPLSPFFSCSLEFTWLFSIMCFQLSCYYKLGY